MRARIKNYLSVTKKEWNGMVVLVILIALVLAAPYVYQLFRKDNIINFKDFDKAVAQLRQMEHNPVYPANNLNHDTAKLANPVMFPFNPNELNAAQWKLLGLSGYQASVIEHYRLKGGRFYSKADVKKMYTLKPEEYARLEPYICIPEAAAFAKKAKPGEIIELNTADSARMTMIRGIGPSFAVRIVRYRNRLGGFIKKEQLKEIYGIDSVKYAGLTTQVSADASKVKQIAINSISFDQLRIFPYLSYKQVNAIIEYRKQHGNYNSIADMKNIAILDDEILRKIGPYLSFK